MEQQTVSMEVESLEHIMQLFGAYDANIEVLREEMDVSITARDQRLSIHGENVENVALASGVISRLLEMIHRGEAIDRTRIRYAIELARDGNADAIFDLLDDVIAISHRGKVIKSKTLGQKQYVQAMKTNTMTFAVGPAGTGKTYLAMAMAVVALKSKEVQRIILTRPAVEAGEKLGFLPGDLSQKVDPYLRPLYDALYDLMGVESYQKMVERGTIEVAPLGYMRGRTLNDAFIILDEAQNTTVEQMKMFLTRFGFGSRVVVTGDMTQTDLPTGKTSGLKDAFEVLKDIKDIARVQLTYRDVVRHELVQAIVKAYEKAHKQYIR